MEPTPKREKIQQPPEGNWLRRASTAVFHERRLPYSLALRLDKVCKFMGLRHKTVAANGFRIRLRRLTADEEFVANILLQREYSPQGYEIGESDVVVDVGASLGTFTLLAARAAKQGKVYAFEPMTDSYNLLQANIRLNGLTNVYPTKVGISNEAGSQILYLSSHTGSHTLFSQRIGASAKEEKIDCITLRDAFDRFNITRCNFLKLDCEGAEYPILFTLAADYFDRIEKIAMEYHATSLEKKREEGDAMVALLEERGFGVDIYTDEVGYRGGHIFAKRR